MSQAIQNTEGQYLMKHQNTQIQHMMDYHILSHLHTAIVTNISKDTTVTL